MSPASVSASTGVGAMGSPETPRTSSFHNNNHVNNNTNTIEFEPPLACVRRILKTALPSSTNVGKDASAAFCRASGIFVLYITACANDFARENKRQTITANDVLAAVKELDFDDLTPQLTTFLEKYRATEKTKRDAKAAAKADGGSRKKQRVSIDEVDSDDDDREDEEEESKADVGEE